MDLKKTNINKILFITTVILLISYLLSFTRSFSTDKRKIVKSALVNNKNKELIKEFELRSGDEKLNFLLKNNIWYGSKSSDNENLIPLDKEIMNRFIQTLTNVTEMYKISDTITKNSAYGLLSESAFHIKYYINDSDYSEIIIGDTDFSQSARYLMSNKNTTVYQISNILETYLNLNLQFWAEPYIISKQLFSGDYSTIQRVLIENNDTLKKITPSTDNYIKSISSLLELRHGGVISEKSYKYIKNHINLHPDLIVKLENGDKSEVRLSFYSVTDELLSDNDNDEIVVKCEYSNFNTSFYYKISQWTYNRYKDITL